MLGEGKEKRSGVDTELMEKSERERTGVRFTVPMCYEEMNDVTIMKRK